MVVTLAFYKGTLAENDHAKLFDRVVCWRTRGRFSHVELVLPNGFCASSSFRDGGVRFKRIDLNSGRWELVQYEGDPSEACRWFAAHENAQYDAFSLLAFAVPWRMSDARRWYCSEAVATALGLWDSPDKISPNLLYSIALKQPGAVKVLSNS
jgi:hypothetical protein